MDKKQSDDKWGVCGVRSGRFHGLDHGSASYYLWWTWQPLPRATTAASGALPPELDMLYYLRRRWTNVGEFNRSISVAWIRTDRALVGR
jgi:hypothetical protein